MTSDDKEYQLLAELYAALLVDYNRRGKELVALRQELAEARGHQKYAVEGMQIMVKRAQSAEAQLSSGVPWSVRQAVRKAMDTTDAQAAQILHDWLFELPPPTAVSGVTT